LKSLANEKRQTIVSYLILRGDASPKEISEKLDMKSNELAYHLRELVMGNILERRIVEGKVKYRLSFFGAKLVYHMFEALMPPKARRKEESTQTPYDYTYLTPIMGDDIGEVYKYPEPADYALESG